MRDGADPGSGPSSGAQDRHVADMLGLPHRLYRELKPTGYRWSHLAPANHAVVVRALDERWSVEKTADYLDATVSEAEACLQRYRMSLYIEQGKDAGDRICRAVASWLSRFEELSKAERENLAKDLALHLANQLDWAAEKGHTLRQVADLLEPKVDLEAELRGEVEKKVDNHGETLRAMPKDDPNLREPPPKWGPQWKDG